MRSKNTTKFSLYSCNLDTWPVSRRGFPGNSFDCPIPHFLHTWFSKKNKDRIPEKTLVDIAKLFFCFGSHTRLEAKTPVASPTSPCQEATSAPPSGMSCSSALDWLEAWLFRGRFLWGYDWPKLFYINLGLEIPNLLVDQKTLAWKIEPPGWMHSLLQPSSIQSCACTLPLALATLRLCKERTTCRCEYISWIYSMQNIRKFLKVQDEEQIKGWNTKIENHGI